MFSIHIDDWFYWGETFCSKTELQPQADKRCELSDIPAMQRRRLPTAAKRIHQFARAAAEQQVPLIYTSANSEIAQALSIIRSFDSDVSPAKFSVSVHNAIAGLLSVIHQNQQSYQAIDSFSGLLETALAEAYGLLCQGHRRVGIVYYDEALPVAFQTTQTTATTPLRVLGLTVSAGAELQLAQRPQAGTGINDMATEQAAVERIVDFLRFEQTRLDNPYARVCWQWRRDDVA